MYASFSWVNSQVVDHLTWPWRQCERPGEAENSGDDEKKQQMADGRMLKPQDKCFPSNCAPYNDLQPTSTEQTPAREVVPWKI